MPRLLPFAGRPPDEGRGDDVSEFTWSDEAVDAAAKALCDEWPMVSRDLRARWESLYPLRDPGVPEAWLVRAVLAALAPFVSAMLDEARGENDCHVCHGTGRDLHASDRRPGGEWRADEADEGGERCRVTT